MAYARCLKRRIVQPKHSRLVFAIGVGLAILGLAASEARAQQTDTLQRASTLYQKAQTAYEAEEDEDAIDHLEQIEELLADRSRPTVDTLRARRLALLSKAQYRVGELGGAQRAHIKMTKTGAVPAGLVDEMADHRQRVETALMKEVPKAVRSSIRRAVAMDTLDLSGRGLIGLPDSVGRLMPRQRVDLSGNDLPSLPKGIGQWTKVQELDVSNNRLGCVPENIGQLSRLEELDLSGNRLTELPSSIGRLSNLRGLDLSGNSLSELPESIGQLTSLRRLDPSGNELTALPSSVGELAHLRRLDVSENSGSLTRQVRETRLLGLLPDTNTVVYPSPLLEADSSRWGQTAQILVPLDQEEDLNVFLDTLKQVISRTESLTVRRGPAQPKQSLSEIRTELIDEEAIGLSMSHARIDYEFRVEEGEYREEIEAIQFLFRHEFKEEEGISMLYVGGQRPWVQDILRNKGIPPQRIKLRTFNDELAFVRMHSEGKIVKIANQPVREGFKQKKQQLIEKITRLTYETR